MAQIVQAHKKMITDTTPIRRKSSKKLMPGQRLTDKALNNLFNQQPDYQNRSAQLKSSRRSELVSLPDFNPTLSQNKSPDCLTIATPRPSLKRSNSTAMNPDVKDQIANLNKKIVHKQGNDDLAFNVFLKQKAKKRMIASILLEQHEERKVFQKSVTK